MYLKKKKKTRAWGKRQNQKFTKPSCCILFYMEMNLGSYTSFMYTYMKISTCIVCTSFSVCTERTSLSVSSSSQAGSQTWRFAANKPPYRARMKDYRLPKTLLFGELVDSLCYVGWSKIVNLTVLVRILITQLSRDVLNHMRMNFWQWICWSNTFDKHMCSNWCTMLWFIHYLIKVTFTIIALLLAHTWWKILCSVLTSTGLSHPLRLWQMVIFPPWTTAKCDHSTSHTISEILWPSHLIKTICLLSNLLSIYLLFHNIKIKCFRITCLYTSDLNVCSCYETIAVILVICWWF